MLVLNVFATSKTYVFNFRKGNLSNYKLIMMSDIFVSMIEIYFILSLEGIKQILSMTMMFTLI